MLIGAAAAESPVCTASAARLPRRAWLWTLPMLLAGLFAAGVAIWAQNNATTERDEARKTMISDALSVEAQLRARIESESTHLRNAAEELHQAHRYVEALASNGEVGAGLRRLWQSVTWLDANNRIVAHVPQDTPASVIGTRGLEEDGGLSMHLTAPLQGSPSDSEAVPERSAGVLVARYSPTALLKRGVPWWLSRKYDVQLVDTFGEVIASNADYSVLASGDSYEVSFTGHSLQDIYVRLTQREVIAAWYQTLLPVLLAASVLMALVASGLLRRQVRNVSRAEAAWRTEAAWRSAMDESALVGLRARDLNGRVLHVNRTFCRLVGFDAASLVGLAPPMPYWPLEELEEVLLRHQRTLAGEAPREGYQARWRHKDGSLLDVMVFESPLVDATGVQVGWMGSIIDITKTKRLEERERNRTEVSAHHARLTMLGEIASTLAHELNQPLTAITSYTAGIANSIKRNPTPDPVLQSAVERLAKQVAHAGRIVERIREFLTRRVPRHEPCSLDDIARDAVDLQRREFERHGIRLIQDFDDHLPKLIIDPVLIEQVLLNLLRNAADAMATQVHERVLKVTTRRTSTDLVQITVIDNGPGLGGRSIDALCEPFYTTKPEGMGMGLAICRSIVEAHHGVLDAWNELGAGAVFSLSLPVTPLAETEADMT